jgi:hypothetical protein
VQIYEQTIPARGCSVDLDAAGRPSPSVPLVLSLDPARITSSKITTQIIAFFLLCMRRRAGQPAGRRQSSCCLKGLNARVILGRRTMQ